MNHSITTTGTTEDPVRTPHESGESVQGWVKRHDKKVSASTPSGDSLTTTWPCANGQESTTTDRLPGESDTAFVQRHILEYLLGMIECPPVP